MSKPDIDELENRLLQERSRALEAVRRAEAMEAEGQRESAGELSRVPQHFADAGSDTQESEKDRAIIDRGSERLTRIDTALRLLREEPDSYRTCERCGREIEAERLDLVPWTRWCSTCAQEVESAGPTPPGVVG